MVGESLATSSGMGGKEVVGVVDEVVTGCAVRGAAAQVGGGPWKYPGE